MALYYGLMYLVPLLPLVSYLNHTTALFALSEEAVLTRLASFSVIFYKEFNIYHLYRQEGLPDRGRGIFLSQQKRSCIFVEVAYV